MIDQLKRMTNLFNFRTFLIVVLLATGLLQFLLMVGNVRGVTYDIKSFQLAPETIRAVKTIEDTEKTEEERESAAKLVKPVYKFSEDVAKHRVSLVDSVFTMVLSVREEIKKDNQEASKEEQIALLKKRLEGFTQSQSQLTFTDENLWALLLAEEQHLHNAKSIIEKLVKNTLSKPIRTENIISVRNALDSEIRQQMTIDSSILNPVIIIGRAAIVETDLLDDVETDRLVQQARAAVEPTKILQGQIIVQEGELIEREVYRQLELLGMLDNKESIKPVFGLIILIILQMAFLYFLFIRGKKPNEEKRKAVLVTAIVYSLSIVLMESVNLLADNIDFTVTFIYPTALATMLVRLLASDKAAVLVTVLTAVSAGVIFQEGYTAVLQMDIALYIIFGGFASLFFLRSLERRTHLLHACGYVSLINIIFIAFYLLMSQSDYQMTELLYYVIAALTSGVLSGALTMGLLPFFESAFGILSTMRLIELSNPNHPLLKQLLTKTPGTYHHSLMVANLAEAACEAIEADGLLARVGCYYHDVGKMRRPAFFIENQMSGINPHDSMPPERSAEIIIAHTTEGAEMLKKHKMPQEIINIALQHHGTSSLKYFLHKAKEAGTVKDESIFYYPGPKPQTKEAAVISIADSVEAAVRSMKQPNAEKIRALVHSIIQGRLSEDQFDECDISIKELKKIEDVLCETLNGTFHSRIEYPKDEK